MPAVGRTSDPSLPAASMAAGRYAFGARSPVLDELPPLPSCLRTFPCPPWLELSWLPVGSSPPGPVERPSWSSRAPRDWSMPTPKRGCSLPPAPPSRPPASGAASPRARSRGERVLRAGGAVGINEHAFLGARRRGGGEGQEQCGECRFYHESPTDARAPVVHQPAPLASTRSSLTRAGSRPHSRPEADR